MTSVSPRAEVLPLPASRADLLPDSKSGRKVQFYEQPAVYANGSAEAGHQQLPASSPRAQASSPRDAPPHQPPIQVSPFAKVAQIAPDDASSPRPMALREGVLPGGRAVSWQDMYGRELVTVREFEPSEAGGSDSGHWGDTHKGCCSVM